jgi:hypothetical protein
VRTSRERGTAVSINYFTRYGQASSGSRVYASLPDTNGWTVGATGRTADAFPTW